MQNLPLSLAMALIVSSTVAIAADGDDALFGLKWGMTVQDVKAAGVNLTKMKNDRNLETYRAPAVPRGLSDFEIYSFVFADGKLVKLWALSKDIVDDPTGNTGKERFGALRTMLSEKYGKPAQNHQVIGSILFKGADEFYQCLAYRGCGLWVAGFETPEKDVYVHLKGLRRGTGYLDVTAEANPQWGRALEIFKEKKAKSDKDAL